jgi:hypothetical protein
LLRRNSPHAKVAALNIAGRDVSRDTAHYVAGYGYYSGGAVAARGFVYVDVYYAVGLDDNAVRHAIAECIADRVWYRAGSRPC